MSLCPYLRINGGGWSVSYEKGVRSWDGNHGAILSMRDTVLLRRTMCTDETEFLPDKERVKSKKNQPRISTNVAVDPRLFNTKNPQRK